MKWKQGDYLYLNYCTETELRIKAIWMSPEDILLPLSLLSLLEQQ